MATILPPIDLEELIGDMRYELYELEATPPEPQLICARFSDHMRDLEREPISLIDFQIATADLDDEGMKRLSLLVETLMLVEALDDNITSSGYGSWDLLEQHIVHLAQEKRLLPIELMQLSEVRLEEFARSFLAQLSHPIEGESAEQSALRLVEIDYESLLGEADRAQQAAEERLAELRRIQEEERAAFNRSKW